ICARIHQVHLQSDTRSTPRSANRNPLLAATDLHPASSSPGAVLPMYPRMMPGTEKYLGVQRMQGGMWRSNLHTPARSWLSISIFVLSFPHLQAVGPRLRLESEDAKG